MRLVQIAEVLKLECGEKVPATRGKIKSVFNANSGENDKGAWTIQNITLVDPANPKAELKVKLFNQNEIPTAWKNKMLYIESAQGEKGLKAVTLAQDTYKWKEGQPIKKILEVRDEAIVGLDDDAKRAQEAPAPESATERRAPEETRAQGQAPAQGQPRPQIVPGSVQDQAANVQKARAFLGKAVNGLELAVDAALYLNGRVKARHKDFAGFTPEEIERIAVHLSISLGREDCFAGLPSGPLDKVYAFIEQQKASKQTTKSQ